jgi:hypothetical protein
MLFGDLKNGGWLTISVTDDKITLIAKPKTPKVQTITFDKMFEVNDADV